MVGMRVPEADGLVHHWARGPMDVTRLSEVHVIPTFQGTEHRCDWEFRYWIERPYGIDWLEPWAVEAKVDFVLNKQERSWARSGVWFRPVDRIEDCNIVLRFSNGPPPDWPHLLPGLGWHYRDSRLGRNVAHVSAQASVFNNIPLFNAVLGMELVGHGTFRMWDMYIAEHEPYLMGSMGRLEVAFLNDGFPSDVEIECAKAWLRDDAVHVHAHPEFTVPTGAHTHEDVPGGEHTHGP